MAQFKIKYFATEYDDIAYNGGIAINEYITEPGEYASFSDILENFDEDILINIERIIER